MATKNEKAAPKKKEKPTPLPCTCKRLPVISKIRAGAFIVGCPHWLDCDNSVTSGRQPTEADAIKAWNTAIASLLNKEARK